MTNWICLTDDINFDIIEKEKIWGVSDKHKKKIKRLRRGDNLVFYQIKNPIKSDSFPCIRGYGKVASKFYRDESRLFGLAGTWKFGEIFPNRVKLSSINISKKIFHFKEIIPELDFFWNKNYWSLHILGQAMVEINDKDYQRIISKIM